ncbi:MAG TPA: folylpolyglutamate synthase/dihydrofolate synthase family protein [Terriglobia bacterium]|jgi:dihydrofolate synthase/folylpolyglutamate synthase|nr:folylpolyglutamate synthase/dihydrofolate synthase family protein [Terriglobia bacterium]
MTDFIQAQSAIPFDECLRILWDRGHELHGRKFDLEAIRSILAVMGHPERRYFTAIIAGTNGKGSTSAMLAAILERSRYRTGLYTSPHLVRVNERIRVNGADISDEDFAAAFTAVHRAVEKLIQENVLPHRPSFFEYLTATAFEHFARAGVDFAVLEVGMGGRLDATNVTDASVAVITNVDLDHQEFLGNTIAAIAREKAGVIKPGRPVVSGCEHPEAIAVVRRKCDEAGVELIETSGLQSVRNLFHMDGRYSFDLEKNGWSLPGITLSMAGKFQVRNAVMAAVTALKLAEGGFNIPHQAILEGLRVASWPGRLEIIRQRPLILLDGAHNPAAAREVAEFVQEHFAGRKLRLVYASMRDKAIGEISNILFPLAEMVYVTRPQVERAAEPEAILAASRVQPQQAVIEPDPVRALEQAVFSSAPEDIVLVAGSLFLVGAIKKAVLTGRLVPERLTSQEVLSEYC